MNHNRLNNGSERQELPPIYNRTAVWYGKGGGGALFWNVPGATAGLRTSSGALDTHVGQPGFTTYGFLTTESGSQYGFGEGVVVKRDKRTGETHAFDLKTPIGPITIGESLVIPGVVDGGTTRVKSFSVPFAPRNANVEGVPSGFEEIDAGSPFPWLEAVLPGAHQALADNAGR